MSHYFKILGAGVILTMAVSCAKTTQTSIYTANAPEYISYDELRSSIKNDASQTLEKPGRIFLYDNYIFINEFEKGIHIYDNSDPTNPSHINFINIPGNVDMAIKDGRLYADSHVDLVVLDLSDIRNIQEITRANDVLSYTLPSLADNNYPVSKIDESLGIVSGFAIKEVTETCENKECGTVYRNTFDSQMEGFGNNMISNEGVPVSFAGNTNNVRSIVSTSNSTALSGSMARFMMVEDHLYVVSNRTTISVFNIQSANPNLVKEFQPWAEAGNQNGNVIETLFRLEDKLFIGSNNGMLIYDVVTPASPNYLSSYTHLTSCDPVVATEDYAFVTLRNGTACGMASNNQLDILDIKDIMNPNVVNEIEMTNPFGLAIDDEKSLLFVCDGYNGLKVLDAKNPNFDARVITHLSSIETYDVILHRDMAHVIGRDGLSILSYNEDGALNTISKIALGN